MVLKWLLRQGKWIIYSKTMVNKERQINPWRIADYDNIAKIGYPLSEPDSIISAGKTRAYTHMVNGKNKTADTVLYEKNIGEKSYYVVQAIPNTKAKTLYVVTAFIGKQGYKKEASQLINAKSLDVTAQTGSAKTSINRIPQNSNFVKFQESGHSSETSELNQYRKNLDTDPDEKSFLSLDDYVDDDSYERVLKRKNNALQEETESQIVAIHQMFRDGDITESEMLAAENDVMKNLFKKVNRQTHNYVRILRDRNNQRAAAKKTRGEVKGELRSEMTETERKRVLRESIRRRVKSFSNTLRANTNTRNIPENLKPVTQDFVKLVYADNFEKDNLNNCKVIVK